MHPFIAYTMPCVDDLLMPEINAPVGATKLKFTRERKMAVTRHPSE